MSDLADRIARLSPEQRRLLMHQLAGKNPGVAAPLQGRPRGDQRQTFPLSSGQERLWFLDQLTPGSALYNIPAVLRLNGRLDVDVLEQSLQALVQRHEALRTTFAAVAGRPVQVVAPHMSLPLRRVDLRALPPGPQAATARQHSLQEAQQPFDLTAGPLLRATVLHLDDAEHVLLLTMHHIISDGWSLGVLLHDLGAFYTATVRGQEPDLAPLALQYADYALWQRRWLQGSALAEQLAYWRAQLAGAPPVLALPTDRPRPAMQSYAGATYPVVLPGALVEALRALSRRAGVTVFMTLLAAFQLLLARSTGQQDIVVGTPIAGRTRTETEGLIGFFVNTLVLRTDLAGSPSFVDLLGRVRETCLGAYAHQDVPFEKLVEELQPPRDLSRPTLVQVMCELLNTPPPVFVVPGLAPSRVEPVDETAKFDLTLSLMDGEGRLSGSVVYNADLFTEAAIGSLVSGFQTLLGVIVADPDQVIWALPVRADAVQLEAEELDELFV
jgi:hypothetical protein